MNIETCAKKEQEYIIDELVEYNLSKVSSSQEELFIDLSKKIVDGDKIIAGIIARMYCWNIVYVDTLWVASNYRNNKYGSILLKEVENEARAKGAKLIHLDTFDFQAKDFYEKQGYSIFGKLEDCPENHCRYYMKKML
jgi:ribosomal protein S18 acetylase RimI-like enzyme